MFSVSFISALCFTLVPFELVANQDWQPICPPRPDEVRQDCHPEENATEEACRQRKCCWMSPTSGGYQRAPYCFFPLNYPQYKTDSIIFDSNEQSYTFALNKTAASPHLPQEINQLTATLAPYGEGIVRLKIFDAQDKRYEVPFVLKDNPGFSSVMSDVEVIYTNNPFGIKLKRASNGQKLLDTTIGPLLFANRFIEFSTELPSSYVYGLGEHRTQFQISTNWRRLAFYTRDQATVIDDNLYGNHPFLMSIDDSDDAYGIFMLNSNAMETIFTPYPQVTYRTIGGIIDLFIMVGPTPADVIRQYWRLIGKPIFSPYWSVGFHLSRWNYGTLANLTQVTNEMKAYGFPYDVQWTDIDALDHKRIFTYDRDKWADLPNFVQQLHSESIKYISINDPGISCDMSIGPYATYDRGIKDDIYVRWANGSGYLVGEVWPGLTVYPSWVHPNSLSWWANELISWDRTLSVDGLWIDMNEVSSFVYGSIDGCNEPEDNPFYVPRIFERKLWAKTICPSARHVNYTEYDIHSLYGHTWAIVTHNALLRLRKSRPFILTRASFSGSGNWTAKWGGDNFATFNDLYYSITDILNFNIFGFSSTGDDLCGFIFDTTEELCTRWFQLGAFYTFMRNHNNDASIPHHPTAFKPAVVKIMKNSVIGRYRLLPHLYTLLYESHMKSQTVFQPMFFQYWKDRQTHSIDTQFMLGDAFLIVPVLQDQHRQVHVYFPQDSNDYWYDFVNYNLVSDSNVRGWKVLDAPIDLINVFVKNGHIIPMHNVDFSETKNAMQLKNEAKFKLLFVSKQTPLEAWAVGSLFWDDGESQLSDSKFNYVTFTGGYRFMNIESRKNTFKMPMIVEEISVTGFGNHDLVSGVSVDGQFVQTYSVDSVSRSLTIFNLSIDMQSSHKIEWEITYI